MKRTEQMFNRKVKWTPDRIRALQSYLGCNQRALSLMVTAKFGRKPNDGMMSIWLYQHMPSPQNEQAFSEIADEIGFTDEVYKQIKSGIEIQRESS